MNQTMKSVESVGSVGSTVTNKTTNKTWSLAVFATLTALTVGTLWGPAAQAARASRDVFLKIEPIQTSDEESLKKQEDRQSAVNRALQQALNERAKSQTDFERNAAVGRPQDDLIVKESRAERLASRSRMTADRERRSSENRLDIEARDARAQMGRDLREESRREKRLNWLND